MLIVEMDRTMLDGPEVLDRFRARRRADLHACALTGYEAGGFHLRNSWGKGWGRGGYALATSEWLRRAVRESYGVEFPRLNLRQVGRGEALPGRGLPAARQRDGALEVRRSPRRTGPSAAASSPSRALHRAPARPAVAHHRVEVA